MPSLLVPAGSALGSDDIDLLGPPGNPSRHYSQLVDGSDRWFLADFETCTRSAVWDILHLGYFALDEHLLTDDAANVLQICRPDEPMFWCQMRPSTRFVEMSTLFGANFAIRDVSLFSISAPLLLFRSLGMLHTTVATVTTNRPLPQLESNQSLCLFQALMHGQVPTPQIRVDALTACYIWSQTCALESSCIAELYAGGYGGWSRAFHVINQETGLSWNSVLAVEHQKLIAECFATNHDRTLYSQTGGFFQIPSNTRPCIVDDVSVLNVSLSGHKLSGIAASPPCPPWSGAARKEGLSDARGREFLNLILIMRISRVPWTMIENVRSIVDHRHMSFIRMAFKWAGFNIKWERTSSLQISGLCLGLGGFASC